MSNAVIQTSKKTIVHPDGTTTAQKWSTSHLPSGTVVMEESAVETYPDQHDNARNFGGPENRLIVHPRYGGDARDGYSPRPEPHIQLRPEPPRSTPWSPAHPCSNSPAHRLEDDFRRREDEMILSEMKEVFLNFKHNRGQGAHSQQGQSSFSHQHGHPGPYHQQGPPGPYPSRPSNSCAQCCGHLSPHGCCNTGMPQRGVFPSTQGQGCCRPGCGHR